MALVQAAPSTTGGSIYSLIDETSENMAASKNAVEVEVEYNGKKRTIKGVAQTNQQSGIINLAGMLADQTSKNFVSFVQPISGEGTRLIQKITPKESEAMVRDFATNGAFGFIGALASTLLPILLGGSGDRRVVDLNDQTATGVKTFNTNLSVGPGVLSTSFPTIVLSDNSSQEPRQSGSVPAVIDDSMFATVLSKGVEYGAKQFTNQLNVQVENMANFLRDHYSEHLAKIADNPENNQQLINEVASALEETQAFKSFLDTLGSIASAVSAAAPAVLTVAKAIASVI